MNVPFFKIYWDKEDIKHISKIIRSGMHWAEGNCIEEFESKVAKYIGRKYCVVFNSGTSALHAILIAYDIKNSDEVITPSFTFIATANVSLSVGAKPVFADIEKETLGLDPDDVERKIASKTKAIIAVHYGGCPCKIREIRRIAQRRKLILIEDAAEAFGAKIGGKKVGTFGDIAMFSFCQNKIITTGEGGAAVTDSKEIYEKLKLIRSHGKSKVSYRQPEDYVTLGYNFRMASFVAALGLAQLNKADKLIKIRRKNAAYLTNKLKQITKKIMTFNAIKDYYNVYQMYPIRIDDRDDFIKYLAAAGITAKIYFKPVHLTNFYKYKLRYKCRLPATEKISREILSLPMDATLTERQMDYMVEKIKKYEKY